jgi:NAD(P)-dependent dehydrogenase (short-subunit alcohol dehydrogenase family)
MSSGLIIVTGGARGIGASACRQLAAAGYAVAVNYASDRKAAEATVAAIEKSGGRARAFRADVADPEQVAKLFEDAVAALGPLAGLVNNAGVLGAFARVEDLDPVELSRLFQVNVIGTILCAKEAVRRLSTSHGGPGGSIVNISSVAARTGGLPSRAPYAASKGAIETFTRGLANEVGREGIRVNAVAPGMIATDMSTPILSAPGERERIASSIPIGRLGEPDDIAEAIVWLISPAARYVTGSVMTVSGGR